MTPEEMQAEITRLKTANTELVGNYRVITAKLGGKSLDAILADAGALADAVRQRDELAAEKAKGGSKQDFDAEVERRANAVRSEFSPKLEEKDRTIQKLSSKIKEMTVVDEAVKRVGDALYKNASEDFRAYIRANCSLNENDEIVVVDGNGKPRYSPADPSKLMTLDELISGLKTSRDHWWASRVPAGGHDPAKGGGGAVGTIKNYADLEAMSKTHDIKTVADAFAKLPEETKKAIRLEMRAKGIQV